VRVLLDRFELTERVARGGMGDVFRSRDRLSGATVAVKLVFSDGPRFAREASVLARLEHPGIVRYIAHGEAEGEQFLAMEWLEGEDLETRLTRGALSVDETFALGARVAEALAAAHAAGVVHRDIKPSNLFLVGGAVERVKLVDFGIARTGAGTQTATGAVFGTPAYMAPEQARGTREVDARADVFALGCVLYECLAGQATFAGEHPVAILGRVLLEEPRPLAELATVPPALDEVISRMLAKSAAERPANGAEVVSALASAAAASGSFTKAMLFEPTALTAAELRLVSVLLVDQPGADSAATLAMSEASVAPVDPLVALARRFEARLERLKRDTRVLVVSGSGVATDQAAHAARLALAVRDSLPDARLALATGRGVVGARTPVGEVLERAARLLSASRAVPVDDVTAGLVGGRFVVGSDGSGGSDGAASASLTLVAERGQDEARRLLGRETPIVGRERELGTIQALFAECESESLARAVVVTGPAGIGKSRLEHEVLRALSARGEPVEVWLARGELLGSGSAFAVLGSALRRAAGIESGDTALTKQAKLRARVGRHVAAADLARVAEFLGEIVGAEFAPSVQLAAARANAEVMAQQVRRAFEDLCAAETATRPLVLVLDDLHWGDLPTVRLVDAALRHCAERPLFVLALARPEIEEVFPKLWHARGVQEIRLAELPRKASERLARHVLGDGADADVIARVVERSAGNAFFLEELLRGAAAGDSSSPATVLAMLQARLEGLESDARRVLRAASVFGQAFWAGGVASLLAGDADLAARWLTELERRELVTRRRESRFTGESELSFRHALVREAAYAMLTDDDRALGHRLAADWLEAAGCEDALVLAEHRERAGDGLGAARWYLPAAEQALDGDDLEGARARAARGLVCGATGATGATSALLGELHRVHAEATQLLGAEREAVASGREALALLDPASASWGRTASTVAAALGALADLDALEALTTEIAQPPVTATRAFALVRAARSLTFSGRPARGVALLEQVEALALDDEAVVASLQSLRGVLVSFAGDRYRSTQLYTESSARWERLGDQRRLAVDRHNLAGAFMWLGDYPRAERIFRDVEKELRRMALAGFLAMLQQNLGYAIFRQRRYDEALALFAESLEFCEATGTRRLASAACSYRAMVLLEQGDPETALREGRAGLDYLDELPAIRAIGLGPVADALLALDRPKEALEAIAPAAALLDTGEQLEERAINVRLAQARALRATGQRDAARDVIVAARDGLAVEALRIDDQALRACFERVPEHAAVVALAEQWSAEDQALRPA
jgi:tetratricopeptide (TPR) repeat protein/predicted Ser/Thr protein kinase